MLSCLNLQALTQLPAANDGLQNVVRNRGESGHRLGSEQSAFLTLSSHLEQIPPKLKTLAIRICSNILVWRDSFSAK